MKPLLCLVGAWIGLGLPVVRAEAPPAATATGLTARLDEVFQRLDAGDWPGAAKRLQAPELLQSRDPRYFAAKARIFHAVHGFERAAEPAQQSIGIDDRCVEGIAEQAAVYLEAGTLDEAEKWVRRAIETDPKYAYAYYLLSRLLERRSATANKAQIRKAAETAVALNPRLAEGYLRLGELYRQDGRFAEALRVYGRALTKPLATHRRADLHRHLSETYTSMGNHGLAVKEAKEAIRLEPQALRHYVRLGDAHSAIGKVVPAIKSYERGLQVDGRGPASIPVRRALAQQYMVAGSFPKAIGLYRQLVEMDKRDVEAQYELANALERAGRTSEALTAYQATLAVDPKRFDALVAMGRMYRRKKEYEVALHNLQKAIVVNDQVPGAYEELGYVYAQLGERDQAYEAFQRAVALDENSTTARRGLGKLLLDRGDSAGALRELSAIVSENPTDGEAHYYLAAAYCRLGNGSEASEHFQLSEKYRSPNAGYLLVVVDKNCLKQERLPASPRRR